MNDHSSKVIIRIAQPGEAPQRRPSRILKSGVRISQPVRRGKHSYHTISWWDLGKRVRKTRSSFAEAKKLAEDIEVRIGNGELAMLRFSEAQRATSLRVEEILQGLESPEAAASHYAAFRKYGTPAEILVALEYARKHMRQAVAAVGVSDVFDRMIVLFEKEKGARWVDDLRSRFKPFLKQFVCPIQELSAADVNRWLAGLDVSGRTKNNYRTALKTLFTFAKKRGYLPEDWTHDQRIERFDQAAPTIAIYSPKDGRLLMDAALESLRPYLAIHFFAGMRQREIIGDEEHRPLDWQDINFRKGLIYVPKEVAKGKTPDRIIPIQPNLHAWLKPLAKTSGRVCQLSNVNNPQNRMAEKHGLTLKDNGGRKSFISYRLAITKNIGQVSEEAGNSPAIIKTDYRQPVEIEVAHEWFNIFPRDRQLTFKL